MSLIRRTVVIVAVLCMFLSLAPAAGSGERSVEQGGTAQTGLQGIRRQPRSSPNQPRPVSSSRRSPDAETGSLGQGLGSCEGSIYRSYLPNIQQGGFVPDSWVLGLVDNYDGENHFSFWVRSSNAGVVTIDDMTALFYDGGVVAWTVLIDSVGTAIGGCASTIRALGGVSVYNDYLASSPPPCWACSIVAPGAVDSVDSSTPTLVISLPTDRGELFVDSWIEDAMATAGGDIWWYYGTEGQTITIDLESDDFDSYLTLNNVNGAELANNDDRGDGTLHSQISYTMVDTDYVQIKVRALDGTSTGSYILYVSVSDSEPEVIAAVPVVCGGYTTRLVVGGQAQRAGNSSVRIRANPARSAQQIGLINNSTSAAVLDGPQCVDSVPWWQINYNGIVGWAGEAVDGLPLLVPVGGAPAVSNPPAVGTGPTAVVAVPNSVPTATPVPFVPTPTLVDVPPASGGVLDHGASPNYGTFDLTSGFSPDPYPIGVTSGGTVDVSYLGGGCAGFATSNPDVSLNYTGGAFPLLRIYFMGSGDTTLIINDAVGGWRCSDDSFGTLNPTIDFNSPSSGQYDIWIGTYGAGGYISGTLYITELDSNHP